MCPEKLENVIKSVAEEEDRKLNLIVFGLTEETNENLTNVVSEVFEACLVQSRKLSSEVEWAGKSKSITDTPK